MHPSILWWVMPARRRRTLDRSSARRSELWDRKMSGEVYAMLLPKLKDIALPRVGGYQSTHEHLIATVKSAVERSGENPSLIQEYMWYAEKMWRLTQTYRDKALQMEADALYLWYLVRGRNDLALRTVAKSLGINISPIEEIMDRALSPLLLKVLKRGTLIADGTEQTLIEYSGMVALISGYVDLSNMAEGDEVVIISYVKIREDGDYILYRREVFTGKQPEPALYILPRPAGLAYKVTLQQTAGMYKSFDYLFVKGT